MSVNRVELNGAQTIDYVWVTTTDFSDEEIIEMSDISFELLGMKEHIY